MSRTKSQENHQVHRSLIVHAQHQKFHDRQHLMIKINLHKIHQKSFPALKMKRKKMKNIMKNMTTLQRQQQQPQSQRGFILQD